MCGLGWTRTLRGLETLSPKLRKQDVECRRLLLHFEVNCDLFCKAQQAVPGDTAVWQELFWGGQGGLAHLAGVGFSLYVGDGEPWQLEVIWRV